MKVLATKEEHAQRRSWFVDLCYKMQIIVIVFIWFINDLMALYQL
jgi:hypothetical protein